jgi:hypothetical protein
LWINKNGNKMITEPKMFRINDYKLASDRLDNQLNLVVKRYYNSNRENLMITYGLNGDDFIKNLITVRFFRINSNNQP